MTHSARLTNTYLGLWEVYVVPPGDIPSSQWPAHDFARTVPIPTPNERVTALAALGYEIADEADWEWREISADEGDEAVRLLASTTVRPVMDGGAA